MWLSEYMVHTGRKISPIEFGNKHKAHRPNDDCEDPYEEEDEPQKDVAVSNSCQEFVSLSRSQGLKRCSGKS